MEIRPKSDFSTFEINQWGSHTEVILPIIEEGQVDFMVELGSGEFSTPIYSKKCKKYISVETEPVWLEYMQKQCPEDHITFLHLEDSAIPGELERMFEEEKVPDLVLVDHTHLNFEEQRATIANRLTELGCKFIVIHDMCKNIGEKIVVHPDYDYGINSESVNPSLLIRKKNDK